MSVTMVFPNLPVSDLQRATDFYLGLGFAKNDMFSNESAASIVLNDTAALMLLVEPFFLGFFPEGTTAVLGAERKEVSNAILVGSPAEVDELIAKVGHSGGTVVDGPKDEYGMHTAGFNDPDGHRWDVFYMPDPTQAPEQPAG